MQPVGPALGGTRHVARVVDDHLEQRRPHPTHVLTVEARLGQGARGRIGRVDASLIFSARALVLADLEARRCATPEAVSALEDAMSQRTWWAEQWPEGEQYVAGLVAQDVQDALFETVGPLAGVRQCGAPSTPSTSSPTSAAPTPCGSARSPARPSPRWATCEPRLAG